MSSKNQVEALISKIEAAVDSVLAVTEQCTDEQWQQLVNEEERPVSVVIHHIAYAYPPVADWAMTVAEGKPAPAVTRDGINQFNDAHFEEYTNPTKEETLALLRKNGAAIVERLRELNDEQLNRTTPFELTGGNDINAQMMVEWFLLNHTQNHLKAIKETLAIK